MWDTEPVLFGSNERRNKAAGEVHTVHTVNPGAPGLTGPPPPPHVLRAGGPHAFIGLSKIRATSAMDGVPLA